MRRWVRIAALCTVTAAESIVVVQSGDDGARRTYAPAMRTVERWAAAAGYAYQFKLVNASDLPDAWAAHADDSRANSLKKQRGCFFTSQKARLLRAVAAERALDGWLLYADLDVAVNRRATFDDAPPSPTADAFARLLETLRRCSFAAQESEGATPNAGLLLFRATGGRNPILDAWHRALERVLRMRWPRVRSYCGGCSDQRVLGETLIRFHASRAANASYDGVCARNADRRGPGDLAGQFSDCFARHFSRVSRRSCGDQRFLPESGICLLPASTRLNIHDHAPQLKEKVRDDAFVHSKVEKRQRKAIASWDDA